MTTTHIKQQLRIIGGQWRGRKIQFPALTSLRPTPDRVRETLFNWLTNHILDSHCLDAFAGSGALGLEALSRGAASVTFIDNQLPAIEAIKAHLEKFNCQRGQCLHGQLPDLTLATDKPFDIIFLDPPFDDELLQPICQWLIHYCHADTLLYLEQAKQTPLPNLAPNWRLLKSKQAGRVQYSLFASQLPASA